MVHHVTCEVEVLGFANFADFALGFRDFSKSQWGGINFFENPLGMKKLMENALGFGKLAKISPGAPLGHPGAPQCTLVHPGAPWCTPAGAVSQGVDIFFTTQKSNERNRTMTIDFLNYKTTLEHKEIRSHSFKLMTTSRLSISS